MNFKYDSYWRASFVYIDIDMYRCGVDVINAGATQGF